MWLRDEDNALKTKLSGFAVSNYGQGGPGGVPKENIAVYFRFPDPEERTRTFPHIAIDLIDVEYDQTRAHRAGGYIVQYPLEMATPPVGTNLVSDDMPWPSTLVYQLAAYSRQPWHDRQLSLMLYQFFPEQFGFLDMTTWDGTVRRADLRGVARRDIIDANRKRTFRNVFTIGVSSELYLYQIQDIMQVLSVSADVEVSINSPL
jgi:hypothetical protein